MTTSHNDSWLGEALASYQPTSMTAPEWARFQTEAIALVAKIDPPNAVRARQYLSRLATFLGDLITHDPAADFDALLTPEHVQGYLDRRLAQGTKRGTVVNLQGALNALLRAHSGTGPPPAVSSSRVALESYDPDVLRAAAVDTNIPTVARLVLLAGLGGCDLPVTKNGRRLPAIEVDEAVVQAADLLGLAAGSTPPAVEVGPGEVRAARRGLDDGDAALDVRRLGLTRVRLLAPRVPAHVLMSIPHLGRRAISLVSEECEPTAPEQLRACLRNPPPSSD